MQKLLLMILSCYSAAVFAEVRCAPQSDDYRCYQQHQRRLAAKLVQAGKELERLDKPTANRFYIAQKDWQSFVEANCLYESETAKNISKARHYRAQQKCVAQMYDERFKEVNKMVQWLKR